MLHAFAAGRMRVMRARMRCIGCLRRSIGLGVRVLVQAGGLTDDCLPVRCFVTGVTRVRIGRRTVSGVRVRRPLRAGIVGTVVVGAVVVHATLSAHGVVGRVPGANRLDRVATEAVERRTILDRRHVSRRIARICRAGEGRQQRCADEQRP